MFYILLFIAIAGLSAFLCTLVPYWIPLTLLIAYYVFKGHRLLSYLRD